MLIQQLLSLVPVQVAEDAFSEEYNTSADWDADMGKILTHLKEALKIMDSANFAKHVDDTIENFNVDGLEDASGKMYKAIEAAIDAHGDFYDTMEKAA